MTSFKYDFTGKKFGLIEVIERTNHLGLNGYWLCKCSCGKEIKARTNEVRRENFRSCGCIKKNNFTKHNLSKNPLFATYRGMVNRCYHSKHHAYMSYGGRGIYICNEWLVYPGRFILWSLLNGYEENLQIDRIDNDGPYSPENCRWATPKENSNNKRTSKKLIFRGEVYSYAQFAEVISERRGRKLFRGKIGIKIKNGATPEEIYNHYLGDGK